jgi:hypothetical protein
MELSFLPENRTHLINNVKAALVLAGLAQGGHGFTIDKVWAKR